MSRKLKIRKGLESPLLIRGMQVQHYYLLIAVSVVLAFIVVLILLTAVKSQNSGSFALLLLVLAIGLTILFFLWQLLKRKGKIKRYDFPRRERTLTNRDIMSKL